MDDTTKARLPFWLNRTANGDAAAFEALYAATSPQLFTIALRLIRDQRLAEDVLQDAFVQVWHRAGDYHAARGSVFTWMSTLVRYRAIDMLRKQETSGAAMTSNIDVESLDAGALFQGIAGNMGEDPLEAALRDDHGKWLHTCLERLSELQCKCLALAYFHGFSHSELAESLAQPLGTIKSRVRRGLGRLKDCINELVGGRDDS